MESLRSDIATDARYLVWNVAWHVANKGFNCHNPEGDMTRANRCLFRLKKALPDCAGLLDSLKWMAFDASWATTNKRRGFDSTKDKAKSDKHFEVMKISKTWSLKLVCHLRDMCWAAAWHTANSRSDIAVDAENDQVRFEKLVWVITDKSLSDIAQLKDDLLQSGGAVVKARNQQIKWLDVFIGSMKGHEVGVNIAKTTTTVGTVVGTVLLFTPLAAVGVGTLVASAVGSVATTAGDLIANKVKDGSVQEISKRGHKDMLKFRISIAKFNQMAEDIRKLSGCSEDESTAVVMAILKGLAGLGKEAHKIWQSVPFLTNVVSAIRAGASLKTAADVAIGTTKVLATGTRASVCMAEGIATSAEGMALAGGVATPAAEGLVTAGASVASKLALSLAVVGSVISVGDCIFSWATNNPTKQGAIDVRGKFVEQRDGVNGILKVIKE